MNSGIKRALLALSIPIIVLGITACPGVVIDHIVVTFDGGVAVVGATGTFTCISPVTGGVITYQWSFGDGTTAVGQTVTHTYQTDGQFLVECKVITPSAILTFTKLISIESTQGDIVVQDLGCTEISGPSVSHTLPSHVPEGHTIIIYVNVGVVVFLQLPTIVDVASNIYNIAVVEAGIVSGPVTSSIALEAILVSKNANPLVAGETISVNHSGATFLRLCAISVTGLANDPLDQVGALQQPGSSTSFTVPASGPASQASQLIVAASDRVPQIGTTTPEAGFTTVFDNGNNIFMYQVVDNLAGTASASFTSAIPSGWRGLIATFND